MAKDDAEALLIPGFRVVLGRRLLELIKARGTTTVHWQTHRTSRGGPGTVVDADFEDVTDRPRQPGNNDEPSIPGPQGPKRD